MNNFKPQLQPQSQSQQVQPIMAQVPIQPQTQQQQQQPPSSTLISANQQQQPLPTQQQPPQPQPQPVNSNISSQHQYQQQQQQQNSIEMEQKKLQDLLESLTLIASIRDDINVILDNVAKSNLANTNLPSSSSSQIPTTQSVNSLRLQQSQNNPLAPMTTNTNTINPSTTTNANATNDLNESGVPSVSVAVLTPSSVSSNEPPNTTNVTSSTSDIHLAGGRQSQLATSGNDINSMIGGGGGGGLSGGLNVFHNGGDFSLENNFSSSNDIDLDRDEKQAFLDKTNIKFLQDKIMDINKNFV